LSYQIAQLERAFSLSLLEISSLPLHPASGATSRVNVTICGPAPEW